MNEVLMFVLLAALGSLCYWLYFACVKWFAVNHKKFKEEKYVCRFTCFEPRDLHLLDVRAGETREVLTIKKNS